MRETAVEWLEDCFDRYGTLLKSDFIKAKEMEKEQQGYSKDEVLSILDIMLTEYRDSLNHKTDFYPALRFEQFKKK